MAGLKSVKIDFLLISILFLVVFFANLPLADSELITADGSMLLEIGRNLFSGKGAVTSYNIYQFWPGKSHPFLPYIHPVYPIIAGLILFWFNIKAVIGFNILLHAINCVVLYKIIRLYADCLTSFLIALFMGFSELLVMTAIFPWTEQLHLFFIILAIFIYLRYEKAPFLTGIILGISCLTNISSLYKVLAFGIALIALKEFSKKALKEYIQMAFGFLIIFLTYEIFCYFRYGVFPPEHLAAGKTYTITRVWPVAFYKNEFPVLNIGPVNLSLNTILMLIYNNLSTFIYVFGFMKFVFILVPLYVIFDFFKRKTSLFTIFFFQGFCVIFGYALYYAYSPILAATVFEVTRYSMIPFITLGSVGFLSIKEILKSVFSKIGKNWSPALFVIIFLTLFYFDIKSYLPFRNYYKNVYPQEVSIYRKNRAEICEWLKANTNKDDLIASHFVQDAFYLERPFVSLPPEVNLTVVNLKDFLSIYDPQYILSYNEKMSNFLKTLGFIEKKRSGVFILLSKN